MPPVGSIRPQTGQPVEPDEVVGPSHGASAPRAVENYAPLLTGGGTIGEAITEQGAAFPAAIPQGPPTDGRVEFFDRLPVQSPVATGAVRAASDAFRRRQLHIANLDATQLRRFLGQESQDNDYRALLAMNAEEVASQFAQHGRPAWLRDAPLWRLYAIPGYQSTWALSWDDPYAERQADERAEQARQASVRADEATYAAGGIPQIDPLTRGGDETLALEQAAVATNDPADEALIYAGLGDQRAEEAFTQMQSLDASTNRGVDPTTADAANEEWQRLLAVNDTETIARYLTAGQFLVDQRLDQVAPFLVPQLDDAAQSVGLDVDVLTYIAAAELALIRQEAAINAGARALIPPWEREQAQPSAFSNAVGAIVPESVRNLTRDAFTGLNVGLGRVAESAAEGVTGGLIDPAEMRIDNAVQDAFRPTTVQTLGAAIQGPTDPLDRISWILAAGAQMSDGDLESEIGNALQELDEAQIANLTEGFRTAGVGDIPTTAIQMLGTYSRFVERFAATIGQLQEHGLDYQDPSTYAEAWAGGWDTTRGMTIADAYGISPTSSLHGAVNFTLPLLMDPLNLLVPTAPHAILGTWDEVTSMLGRKPVQSAYHALMTEGPAAIGDVRWFVYQMHPGMHADDVIDMANLAGEVNAGARAADDAVHQATEIATRYILSGGRPAYYGRGMLDHFVQRAVARAFHDGDAMSTAIRRMGGGPRAGSEISRMFAHVDWENTFPIADDMLNTKLGNWLNHIVGDDRAINELMGIYYDGRAAHTATGLDRPLRESLDTIVARAGDELDLELDLARFADDPAVRGALINATNATRFSHLSPEAQRVFVSLIPKYGAPHRWDKVTNMSSRAVKSPEGVSDTLAVEVAAAARLELDPYAAVLRAEPELAALPIPITPRFDPTNYAFPASSGQVAWYALRRSTFDLPKVSRFTAGVRREVLRWIQNNRTLNRLTEQTKFFMIGKPASAMRAASDETLRYGSAGQYGIAGAADSFWLQTRAYAQRGAQRAKGIKPGDEEFRTINEWMQGVLDRRSAARGISTHTVPEALTGRGPRMLPTTGTPNAYVPATYGERGNTAIMNEAARQAQVDELIQVSLDDVWATRMRSAWNAGGGRWNDQAREAADQSVRDVINADPTDWMRPRPHVVFNQGGQAEVVFMTPPSVEHIVRGYRALDDLLIGGRRGRAGVQHRAFKLYSDGALARVTPGGVPPSISDELLRSRGLLSSRLEPRTVRKMYGKAGHRSDIRASTMDYLFGTGADVRTGLYYYKTAQKEEERIARLLSEAPLQQLGLRGYLNDVDTADRFLVGRGATDVFTARRAAQDARRAGYVTRWEARRMADFNARQVAGTSTYAQQMSSGTLTDAILNKLWPFYQPQAEQMKFWLRQIGKPSQIFGNPRWRIGVNPRPIARASWAANQTGELDIPGVGGYDVSPYVQIPWQGDSVWGYVPTQLGGMVFPLTFLPRFIANEVFDLDPEQVEALLGRSYFGNPVGDSGIVQLLEAAVMIAQPDWYENLHQGGNSIYMGPADIRARNNVNVALEAETQRLIDQSANPLAFLQAYGAAINGAAIAQRSGREAGVRAAVQRGVNFVQGGRLSLDSDEEALEAGYWQAGIVNRETIDRVTTLIESGEAGDLTGPMAAAMFWGAASVSERNAGINAYGQAIAAPQPFGDLTGTVVRVVDGDSIIVRTATGEEVDVRLAGINAPEVTDPGYETATASLAAILDGQEVQIGTVAGNEIDDYGRPIGFVFVGDDMVNVAAQEWSVSNPFDTITQTMAALVTSGRGGSLPMPYYEMDDQQRLDWEIANLDALPYVIGDYRWADAELQAQDPFRSGQWDGDTFAQMYADGTIRPYTANERVAYAQYRQVEAVRNWTYQHAALLLPNWRGEGSSGDGRNGSGNYYTSIQEIQSSTYFRARPADASEDSNAGIYAEVTAEDLGFPAVPGLTDQPVLSFFKEINNENDVPGWQQWKVTNTAAARWRTLHEGGIVNQFPDAGEEGDWAAAAGRGFTESNIRLFFDNLNDAWDQLQPNDLGLTAMDEARVPDIRAWATGQAQQIVNAIANHELPDIGYHLDNGIWVSFATHWQRFYARTFGTLEPPTTGPAPSAEGELPTELEIIQAAQERPIDMWTREPLEEEAAPEGTLPEEAPPTSTLDPFAEMREEQQP